MMPLSSCVCCSEPFSQLAVSAAAVMTWLWHFVLIWAADAAVTDRALLEAAAQQAVASEIAMSLSYDDDRLPKWARSPVCVNSKVCIWHTNTHNRNPACVRMTELNSPASGNCKHRVSNHVTSKRMADVHVGVYPDKRTWNPRWLRWGTNVPQAYKLQINTQHDALRACPATGRHRAAHVSQQGCATPSAVQSNNTLTTMPSLGSTLLSKLGVCDTFLGKLQVTPCVSEAA